MLKGLKVTIRPIVRDDLDILNEWHNDEATFMYLGGGYRPVSKDQQEKWLDNMIDLTGQFRRFIIEDAGHNRIGLIGLYSINWINRTAEIGVLIGELSSRGKGYAIDAYNTIEKYAKEYLNIRKIKCYVADENISSLSLFNKLNFTNVGRLKEERFVKGYYIDLLIFEKFI